MFRLYTINPWKVMLGICGLSTGIALVVSIVFGISLSITLALLLATSIAMICLRVWSSDVNTRNVIWKQLRVGIVAGLLATATYDASRMMVTTVLNLSFNPFDAWSIFGQLILGQNDKTNYVFLVGFLYHLFNGIFFSVAYCFLIGGRNWRYGILWAFGLEVVMLLIYPSWLNLDNVIAEFTLVSVIGHACYGITLGFISERKLVKYGSFN